MNTRQLVGLVAAACVVCCAGPILAVLAGIAAAGALSSVWIGVAGIAIAGAALVALLALRHSRCSCEVPESKTPVTLRPRR